MNRGKMNPKNKKDTGHYLKQNGHETQTTKQILCTIIDLKGERLDLENKYFSTQTHTKPEGILMLLFFFLSSMRGEFMIRTFLHDF